MDIGRNVAMYRKLKKYTQEELGNLLGVSNQAVSKWESAVSMPDIMLLPKIAEALGVTLDDLYGIEKKQTEGKVKDYDFPEAVNKMVIHKLYKQSGCHNYLRKEAEENSETILFDHVVNGHVYAYISDISGAAFISDDLSIIDCNYKALDSGSIFESKEIASALKKLSDAHVRKVLMYMYMESFQNDNTDYNEFYNKTFLLNDISRGSDLSEDDTLDAVDKLIALRFVKTSIDNYITQYIFEKHKAVRALVIFKAIEGLIQETLVWGVARESSVLINYSFE